jgi:hypothetical protein
MLRVTMRRENRYPMSEILKANSGIDDETFSTANAEVRVDEDDVSLRA